MTIAEHALEAFADQSDTLGRRFGRDRKFVICRGEIGLGVCDRGNRKEITGLPRGLTVRAMFRLKRVYERASAEDGYRVLVDRVWPRGLKKEEARIDEWQREIAPSSELRRWYGHDPDKWSEFRSRYVAELDGKPDLVRELRERARSRTVTLLFGARERERNNAVALKAYLEAHKGD